MWQDPRARQQQTGQAEAGGDGRNTAHWTEEGAGQIRPQDTSRCCGGKFFSAAVGRSGDDNDNGGGRGDDDGDGDNRDKGASLDDDDSQGDDLMIRVTTLMKIHDDDDNKHDNMIMMASSDIIQN